MQVRALWHTEWHQQNTQAPGTRGPAGRAPTSPHAPVNVVSESPSCPSPGQRIMRSLKAGSSVFSLFPKSYIYRQSPLPVPPCIPPRHQHTELVLYTPKTSKEKSSLGGQSLGIPRSSMSSWDGWDGGVGWTERSLYRKQL